MERQNQNHIQNWLHARGVSSNRKENNEILEKTSTICNSNDINSTII